MVSTVPAFAALGGWGGGGVGQNLWVLSKNLSPNPPLHNPVLDRSSKSTDAWLVSNLKSTETDRQRHFISFIDGATLLITNLSTIKTSRHSTTDDRQCRSTNSLSNMLKGRRFRPALHETNPCLMLKLECCPFGDKVLPLHDESHRSQQDPSKIYIAQNFRFPNFCRSVFQTRGSYHLGHL